MLEQHFVQRDAGEHGLSCENDESPRELAIVDRTRPIWPNTAPRDSAAAAELPPAAAPLVATLRALDTLARRSITRDSLSVSVPVRLLPDALSPRRAPRVGDRPGGTKDDGPTVIWLSRVAYNADSTSALVHAAKICRVRAEEEAEEGAYDRALLVPLQWEAARWKVLDPVFLHLH